MPRSHRLFWNTNYSLRSNCFNLLCFCLAGSVFFTNLIDIPHVGSKFQLTELLFLILLFFIPYKAVLVYNTKHNRAFLIIAGFYFLTDLFTSALSQHASSVLESFGRLYLLFIFAILSYQSSTFSKEQFLKKFTKVVILCSLFMIIIAAIGYLLLCLDIRSSFLWPAGNYPYFGIIYRLSGPNQYPTMMICLLTFAIIYMLSIYKTRPPTKSLRFLLILLFICAVATWSKSLVLLTMAVVILILKQYKWLNRFTFITTVLFFSSIMVFFTHLIIVKHNNAAINAIKKTIYTSNRIVYQNPDYVFFEANYLTLKRAALRTFEHHPWIGIGTGNFGRQLAVDKQKGLYPNKLPNFEPQTTYLRAFAENGISGGILLLCVFGYVTRKFLRQPQLKTDDMLFALFLIFITLVIEAISTDIYNFRHLWLLLAISFVYIEKLGTNNGNKDANPSLTA